MWAAPNTMFPVEYVLHNTQDRCASVNLVVKVQLILCLYAYLFMSKSTMLHKVLCSAQCMIAIHWSTVVHSSALHKSLCSGPPIHMFFLLMHNTVFNIFTLCPSSLQQRYGASTSSAPRFGMKMLQKFGWSPGKGLGKYEEGTIEPVIPDGKYFLYTVVFQVTPTNGLTLLGLLFSFLNFSSSLISLSPHFCTSSSHLFRIFVWSASV